MKFNELDAPSSSVTQLLDGKKISKIMYMIWDSREDLRSAFDLRKMSGQHDFYGWYQVEVLKSRRDQLLASSNHLRFLAIARVTFFSALLENRSKLRGIYNYLPLRVKGVVRFFWHRLLVRNAIDISNVGKNFEGSSNNLNEGNALAEGANLIGYAKAELGMGEHVRMTASALTNTKINYGVFNFNYGVPARQNAYFDDAKLSCSNPYSVNIFHINADQMLSAYCHLGRDFFDRRYSIGYWAWELAICPDEWLSAIELVDEIWAPSQFIQAAFSKKTSKPVIYMPLCVSLPPSRNSFSRKYYKLPSDSFIFLFVFDFFSYIERKNPISAIKAFKKAFPDSKAKVSLVLKVMNGDPTSRYWSEMLNEIDGDFRIIILNEIMNRDEVLGLIEMCDCFLSLHRAEGFGRGPAEAMLLGKPTIVTAYSGNMDFTYPDNAYLVDHELVPVNEGDYPFWKGQVWASVSIEHAAYQMQSVFNDKAYAQSIALNGQRYMQKNYSSDAIGKNYESRLIEILAS